MLFKGYRFPVHLRSPYFNTSPPWWDLVLSLSQSNFQVRTMDSQPRIRCLWGKPSIDTSQHTLPIECNSTTANDPDAGQDNSTQLRQEIPPYCRTRKPDEGGGPARDETGRRDHRQILADTSHRLLHRKLTMLRNAARSHVVQCIPRRHPYQRNSCDFWKWETPRTDTWQLLPSNHADPQYTEPYSPVDSHQRYLYICSPINFRNGQGIQGYQAFYHPRRCRS